MPGNRYAANVDQIGSSAVGSTLRQVLTWNRLSSNIYVRLVGTLKQQFSRVVTALSMSLYARFLTMIEHAFATTAAQNPATFHLCNDLPHITAKHSWSPGKRDRSRQNHPFCIP